MYSGDYSVRFNIFANISWLEYGVDVDKTMLVTSITMPVFALEELVDAIGGNLFRRLIVSDVVENITAVVFLELFVG